MTIKQGDKVSYMGKVYVYNGMTIFCDKKWMIHLSTKKDCAFKAIHPNSKYLIKKLK
jgi:hypothetical protein